ncbi:MAG: hypothetical protein CM15mP68_1220 [Pseudomonadota bacterium]|nr:MAG: hypothetical protein CM15mP68_1220 [Pseudomonadota bacterium]
MKREKSGTLTPVFQVGVMSRVRGKIVNTTVSIAKHGRVEAWARAVGFYCDTSALVSAQMSIKT